MRKKIIMGLSIIFLLTILTFTSSAQAADFAGHNFSEDHFAIEVDFGNPTNPNFATPDLINDLLNASAVTADSNEFEDLQFYMAYMNNSNIEAAFSALEKMEHNITFREVLDPDVESKLNLIPDGSGDIAEALDTTILHVNATAPFQQLVQHYTTPWKQDVFVTNNFMCLIAYSANATHQTLTADDELYIGYTFSTQELINAINIVLAEKTEPDYQIKPFSYKASFENTTSSSYKFGIEYTNMFVLWQKMDVKPRGVDIFGGVQDPTGAYIQAETGGVVFGQDIVAASLLDHIGFEYEFTSEEMPGANPHILGTVTSHYNIGETNLLITDEDTIPTANWNHTPFLAAPNYTFQIPANLQSFSIPGLPDALDIPDQVTIQLDTLAFYLDDDAKSRISMQNGFGLTVATATTLFGVSVSNPSFTHTGSTIGIRMGDKAIFNTSFVGKDTYKLFGLETLMGLSNSTDRPVHIFTFDPSGWAIHNVATKYFAVEFALAYGFTKFIAEELTPQFFELAGTADVYVSTMLYFTFTEFPQWYGGEILHDPAYSAVAAMGGDDTSSTGPPGTTGGIPGFEILSALLALPPLYAFYRKRRR